MVVARYILAHWRGQLSLLVSVAVNGLLLYFVLVALLLLIGSVETSATFVYLGMAIFSVWIVWAGVGTFRSAVRTYQSPETTLRRLLLRRAVAVCVMIGLLVVAAVAFNDLVTLFL
jgi:hypothetical protein